MPPYVKLRMVTERGLRDLHVPTPFAFWEAIGESAHGNAHVLVEGTHVKLVKETCAEIATLLDIDRRSHWRPT